MGNKNTLSDLLGRSRNTINTITKNEEIKLRLFNYGYTEEKLESGNILLTKVESFFEQQKREQATAFAASQKYLLGKEAADKAFRKIMKLLRIAGKSNVELLHILPNEVQTNNTNDFFKTTILLYQNLSTPNFKDTLATVGLTPANFAELLSEVKTLHVLYVERETEAAAATAATSTRDKEFDELQDFCKDIRTIAKIAVADNEALKNLVNNL